MIPGVVASASGVVAGFTDPFTGTGSLASRWTNTSGSWTRDADDAYTATAAASYPLASFDANTRNVSVRSEYGVANTLGWGVAFWVTDSNNWWAAVVDRTEYSCQIGTTTGCCACGDQGVSTGFPSCNCVFPPCPDPPFPLCGQTVSAGQCTYPVYGTCYTYVLKLLKRESGVVTTVATANIADGNIGGGLTVAYVQAVTNNAGQITATAQMSTGGAVASIVNTPSSPVRTNRHGIIIAPRTTGTQADRIETFIYAPQ
jgi:hypothetical protein